MKLAQLGLVVGVVQGGHGQPVFDTGKPLGAVITDTPRGRARLGLVGETRLKGSQFGFKHIVLEVADLGTRLAVVTLVVSGEFLAEVSKPGFGL
jgi:hypothetical protein